MKRYAAWGIDKSYRFKWMARLAQWWYWRNRKVVIDQKQDVQARISAGKGE